MLSRWFEEASEAQGSRGTRPQTRPRGEALAGTSWLTYSALSAVCPVRVPADGFFKT